jgi:hypothetical protein
LGSLCELLNKAMFILSDLKVFSWAFSVNSHILAINRIFFMVKTPKLPFSSYFNDFGIKLTSPLALDSCA